MNAARAGINRLRAVWFTLVQTSVASGLSWYLARDVLEHPQPFFAPIAAAVSLSISNVLRAQRAIQMMIGVTLGIGMGTLVQGVLGPGAVSIGVAALIALCAAVFIGHGLIGQGMMFANQTVVSAILVLALFRSGVGWERINDALVGGGVAIVFAIVLFPADPLQVLRRARMGVLDALHGVLTRTADVAAGRRVPAHDWPLSMADRVHRQLGELIEARATARQVVRVAPRRWGARAAVAAADRQALHVAELAGSVLQLARAVVPAADGGCQPLRAPVPAILDQLAAATVLADPDPAGAAAYTAAACRDASTLQAAAHDRAGVLLAGAVAACVDDLQRVIELHRK
ncbi:transmembrane alanine and valine and leucine rich protein [Mycobacterium europaeum]|uniref:Transmembrane alanine and valine and leucine rich protein n=1 Tax=Mycobacterium europaeum TaxID=761804 RepID=A0A0U1DV27_9MYCO|nr:FUSC family protein [Mycobacterium europaeum]CQD22358.1 transmembrane alanine and valine and leucine rich protein [Mycobacterium europaeum]